MIKNVRLRFAPSPTGPLHIGGLRTALFNYLFAKKTGGKLVLRIEDTDLARKVDGSQKHIEDSLRWIGVNFDESTKKGGGFGPYNQSLRKSIYKEHADILIKNDCAYYAFDKKEDLDFHRKNHEKKGKKFIYNAHNRLKLDNSLAIGMSEAKERIKKEDYVVRFKTPEENVVEFNDLIRGDIRVSTRDIDDKILFKSDGMPTYHLANVVDDHLMQISHVIRGEEWLPSLALHILLYRAFKWNTPLFAHLPLILKPTGKGKLSKRDGDKFGFPVYALKWFQEKEYVGFKESGFLSDALVNYMALLGWSPNEEKEIYKPDELIKSFTLEKINKSGAKFDPKKILWVNSQHVQNMSLEKLLELCLTNNPDIENKIMNDFVKLIRPRIETITNLRKQFLYLFEKPELNQQLIHKMKVEGVENAVSEFINKIKLFDEMNLEKIKALLLDCAKKNSLSFGKLMGFLRASIVGKMEGPDVGQMICFLGAEETSSRLKKALIN
tara:strand:+ start:1500 stop:2984 length:1485 start_codon:yes stop_codon:yes gene_type:complete